MFSLRLAAVRQKLAGSAACCSSRAKYIADVPFVLPFVVKHVLFVIVCKGQY